MLTTSLPVPRLLLFGGLLVAAAATNHIASRMIMANPGDDSKLGQETKAEASKIAEYLRLRPGSVFADVGTNDGFWFEQLLPFVRPGGYGYGTDADDEALAGLKARATKLGAGELRVRNLGDANRGLPADSSIDAISMRMSFHYEPKPMAALAAYYRALKPGGKLIIMEHPTCEAARASKADPPTLAELKAKMSREPMPMAGMKMVMSPLTTFGHSMTFESLEPVFADSGFELVEHGPWTGFYFTSCSWFAVFQKPA